ncbi:MAG: hypothetical protein GF355_00385 [Candidatus Eisenbacteria bacterium]|nr:hypothetical protein [Candidatus Eisenbacteria bacterium]
MRAVGCITTILFLLTLAPSGVTAQKGPWGGVGRVEKNDSDPSRLKAIAASLLIPGWGQKLTGHKGRAQVFAGAELGIWTAFAVFQVQGHLRKDSYIEQAEVFAGVRDAGDGDDDYYRLLEQYPSTREYMRDVRRDARARFLDDLEARKAYVAAHQIPASRSWEWYSESARLSYRDKRTDSRRAYQRSSYMIGVAIVNRLISAIDAARSAGSASASKGVAFHVRPDPDYDGPPQVCLSIPIP